METKTRKYSSRRSFAYNAKDEICKKDIDEGSAELTGMLLAAAVISHEDGGAGRTVRFTTESLPVANRLVRIVRSECTPGERVHVAHNSNRHKYTVTVRGADAHLDTLGLTNGVRDVPPATLSTDRRKIALLRGAFLACGSISNPRKTYHLELALASGALAESLRDVLSGLSIRSNIVRRKEHFVLYLNEGDSITALLALIGAHTSILNLENIRILKETRNNVNRAVNCETANINKTVNAAQKQVDSIRRIEQEMGLDRLSGALREAAELRLEHPEASLQELCELCGTTKSGMNHRLRKINAIARALSEEV